MAVAANMHVKLPFLLALLAASLASDIRTKKIKNIIVLPAIIFGLVINAILSGRHGLLDSSLGIFLPVVLLFWLYALKMLGAGDIKLFCASGAIMGLDFVIRSMVFSFLAGGIIALAIMIARRNVKERVRHLASYIKHSFLTMSLKPYNDSINASPSSGFRFSYAVAAGTIICITLKLL
jgi:prepilin peptidase CpaA